MRFSEVIKLVAFRVFGSKARGDEDKYSDMDVFLLTGIDRACPELVFQEWTG